MRKMFARRIDAETLTENIFRLDSVPKGDQHGVQTGKLVSVRADGSLLIDYPGNTSGPLPARSTVRVASTDREKAVLLMFENGDQQLPIIIGIIQDHPVVEPPAGKLAFKTDKIEDIIVDGEKIVFDAKKEIVLRCGEGSITIRADGKIIVKGNNLLSRSKGANRIKGASVNIN